MSPILMQRFSEHPLTALLEPRSIAVVGASPRIGSVGARVLNNLIAGGYGGAVHAVNPKHRRIGELPCVARIGAIGEAVDLALIAVPAARIEEIVADCAAAGVKALTVLSAGFAETGESGRVRQQELVQRVRAAGMRMLGPNCFGLMRPILKLDATFGVSRVQPGSLALISQSGGISAALVDWAAGERIGLSAMVSLGAAADLDFGELIDFFVGDAETRAIMLYVEGIRDGRAFLSALRAAVQIKPVVVLKAGRHADGQRAVSSHSGALLGDDAVFDAALARGGAVRVDSLAQLFAAANALASAPLPAGDRLAIVSNGGGPGVLAADSARTHGIRLAKFSVETTSVLRASLPAAASVGNPVDVLGDAAADRYAAALRALRDDPGVDGVAALFVPQGLSDAEAVADAVIEVAHSGDRPLIAAWLGGPSVERAHEAFEAARVPHCHSPESAVSAFATLAIASRNRNALQRAPRDAPNPAAADLDKLLAIRAAALAAGREWLSGDQALALLTACGLPCVAWQLATDTAAAVAAAERYGYPVALKIQSDAILHKSEVDGVALDLANAADVRAACEKMLARAQERLPQARIDGFLLQPMLQLKHARELLLGLATDPVFGRTLCFGAGGVAVEVMHDVAFGLPPLDAEHAGELIARTRVSRLLDGYRNVPAVDRPALIALLCRLSDLACLLPWVTELDINPLLAHPNGALVLDARVRIDAAAPLHDERYRHLAIHPYPRERETRCTLADGGSYLIRPILPEDAQRERAFIEGLSAETRRRRFHDQLRAPSPQMVARFTQIDYDRELALVALPEASAAPQFAAVARYTPSRDPRDCEFAVTVADAYQGRGLGLALMRLLIAEAQRRGYRRMRGLVLAENQNMLELANDLGFRRVVAGAGRTEVEIELDLQAASTR